MTTQTSRLRLRLESAPARVLLGLTLALLVYLPWASLSAQSSASLPALGEATVDELSLPAERRLGRSIFHQIRRAGVVLDDPEDRKSVV